MGGGRWGKQRVFAGEVCEQLVFLLPGEKDARSCQPPRQSRFADEEERFQYNQRRVLRHWCRIVNENFTPAGYYSTNTFSDEYDVHTREDCRRYCGNYVRRLLRRFPEAKIVYCVGQGKHTARWHAHFLIEGVPEETIREQWEKYYGMVTRCDHLRDNVKGIGGIDMGRDYTALVTYLFAHWRRSDGGHRLYGTTRTLREPDVEPTTEARRTYTVDRPPPPPRRGGRKYVLTEARKTRYGYYYKYVVEPRTGRQRRQ